MSEYFRVLRRLEKEGPARPAPRKSERRVAPVHSVNVPAILDPEPQPKTAMPVAEPSTAAAAEFANLFDNLRALGKERGMRTVVFAAVSAMESVRTVTTGLAAHLERLGVSVLVAELAEWHSRTILRIRAEHGVSGSASADPLLVDLHGRVDLSDVTDWLEHNARDAGFVIIEGQPLAESIDSAIIARAADGLVMVAETEATSRHALRVATERAKMAGCRTLGVVLYGANDRMPAWIRRFVNYEQSLLVTRGE